MDELDDSQRQALHQLRDLTNGADDDVSASVLRTVDWDVQRAAELIFGSGAPPPPPPPRMPIEAFEIDDTHQGAGAPRPRPPTGGGVLALARPLLALLSLPLHVLSAIVRFVLGALRLPLPSLGSLRFASLGLGLGFGRSGRPGQGSRGGGAERWVRELEEDTGAVCRARGAAPRATTSSLAGSSGTSTLTSRTSGAAGGAGAGDDGRRYLPDFALCTYEEFLRICARDARIGCVVLVSSEHDDVAPFKRSTLTDPALVQLLDVNDILVWGGDVREHDAWSASEKLQATTFPFVAFLALQPRRMPGAPPSSAPTSTSTPPSLTVLSRHQGPSTPSGPTSAGALSTHLTTQLLPRVTPFLARLAAAQRERAAERALRAEQDAAFARAAASDTARITAKMAAERATRAAAAAAEEDARLAALAAAEQECLAAARAADRLAWRRWTRRAVVGALAASGTGGLRIAVRLPSGARVVHAFAPSASLTVLYAVVDAALLPADLSPADDPLTLPGQPGGAPELALEQHIAACGADASVYWGFRLASAYPRVEIPWARGIRLGDVGPLKGGGQVVVELVDARRRASAERAAAAQEDADDGYDTEESE